MTGEAWGVLAGVFLTGLVNWGLLSWYLGGTTERVRNQGIWLTKLDLRIDGIDRRLSRVEGGERIRRHE